MEIVETLAADTLINQPMPALAAALRDKTDIIIKRWNALVIQTIPEADDLTTQQVRDSIPEILDQMAKALAAGEPAPTEQLAEITKIHGEARFHESYNVKELILEYRLLRKILIEEVDAAIKRDVTAREWIALDIAVDLALQQAVIAFLQHQRIRLKAATEAEAKFLTFLAHEIRSGLNSVMLTMQWVENALENHKEFTEEREALVTARKSASETITSLERLLQAERLRQKGATPTYIAVSLKTIAEKVAAQLRTAAQRKHLRTQVIVPATAIVHTDEGLLTLILQNLLGNAIKYSDKGTILLSAAPHENGWLLRVSDEGRGISPELLSKLFDAFTRGTNHAEDGAGLGLFIASQAAHTIGAEIAVESKLNEGSTFTVLLPKPHVTAVTQTSA